MIGTGEVATEEVAEEVTSPGALVVSPLSLSEEMADAFEGATLDITPSPRRVSEGAAEAVKAARAFMRRWLEPSPSALAPVVVKVSSSLEGLHPRFEP